jgi:hypothetical protein
MEDKFRNSPEGRIVFLNCAVWVVERFERSGLTLKQWAEMGYALGKIGIGKPSALQELQWRIPEAHKWYSRSGNGKQYPTWEAYWDGSLSNRFYYFFHTTKAAGGKAHPPGIYEWPGAVSVDGKRLIFWRPAGEITF